MASYPTSTASFSPHVSDETIEASHVNALQDEVVAIENGLRSGLTHDLLFLDATYDLGKPGASRPRDISLSRNLTAGGNLVASGVGPHSLGAAASTRFGFQVSGTFTAAGAGGHDVGSIYSQGLIVQSGNPGSLMLIAGALTEAGTGVHPVLAGLRVAVPTINDGVATTTIAATVQIDGAPTLGVTNYALRVPAGLAQFGGQLNADGGIAVQMWEKHTAQLTPATITVDQNAYNPTGMLANRILRLSTSAAVNITGVVAGGLGFLLTVTNVGSFDLIFIHNWGGAASADRIFCPNSANVTLNPNDSVEMYYDGTSAVWRIKGL